jgi:hypothetical protein
VAVAKHSRSIIAAIAVEEYERLNAPEGEMRSASKATCIAKTPRNLVVG